MTQLALGSAASDFTSSLTLVYEHPAKDEQSQAIPSQVIDRRIAHLTSPGDYRTHLPVGLRELSRHIFLFQVLGDHKFRRIRGSRTAGRPPPRPRLGTCFLLFDYCDSGG